MPRLSVTVEIDRDRFTITATKPDGTKFVKREARYPSPDPGTETLSDAFPEQEDFHLAFNKLSEAAFEVSQAMEDMEYI